MLDLYLGGPRALSVRASAALPVERTVHARTRFRFRFGLRDGGAAPLSQMSFRMLFARIVIGSAGFDLHTFECASCDHVHKVIERSPL